MSRDEHIIAVDVGTTSVKVVLFDLAGRICASRTCEYSLERPGPGIVEVDPEVYWSSCYAGIQGAMKDASITPEHVKAIGVTSQAETVITLDRHGRPLRKAIVWLDNRATDEAGRIAEKFSLDDVYRITGQQEIVPTWSAPKIMWIRDHEPDVFRQAGSFMMVEDYVIYRLTSNRVTDHALNPSTLYYNMVEGKWWGDMLDFIGMTESQLPTLTHSGEIVGRVSADLTDLPVGTPVTVSPIDQVSGALGAGNISSGMITETTGCAMAVCATWDHPAYDPDKRFGIYRHARGGLFVQMPWVSSAGMILRWFRDKFAPGEDYSRLTAEAQRVAPGSEGLMFGPNFGDGEVQDATNPNPGFFGLSMNHGRAHVVRSILESIAMSLREQIALLESNGVSVSEVTSLGGAARSDLWLQIKADVLQRPVRTMECTESTCLGAAILASVGTGLHKDLAGAVDAMTRASKVIEPRAKNRDVYDQAFGQYMRAKRRRNGD